MRRPDGAEPAGVVLQGCWRLFWTVWEADDPADPPVKTVAAAWDEAEIRDALTFAERRRLLEIEETGVWIDRVHLHTAAALAAAPEDLRHSIEVPFP